MEMLDRILSMANTIGVFIAIVVSLIVVRRELGFAHGMAMRVKALDYSLYTQQHLIDARMNIEKVFGSIYNRYEPLDPKHIAAKDEEDPDRRVLSSVLILLSHWENMALAIDANVADEAVCFEMVGSSLDQHVKMFRTFIEERRRENPRAYYHLLALRKRWEDKLSQVYIEKVDPLIPVKN